MFNKIQRWKWNFNRVVVLFDLCYFILFNIINISEPIKYISALILVILNAIFLFTKTKKFSLFKSLRLLFRINVPIWVVVIFLTYSKYQSLPFQIIAFALVFISFTSIFTFILLVINRIIEARKLRLAIFFLILFIVLCFTISTLTYQRLVNEGSVIADKQCLNVNPLIIQRKNSYTETIRIAKANGSEEDYWKEQINYLEISKKYIQAQQSWLKEQSAFINRTDYKLFIPKIIQKAGLLQYQSREADMKSTIAVTEMFKSLTDTNKQKELATTILNEKKKQEAAEAELDKIWKSKSNFDIRVRFIRVPKTQCPKENLNIPEVPNIFAPPKQIFRGPWS
ncbi:hypothetical protein A2334_03525 [Candidatus Roizmanbacteria bacterium RIFOXYB2_FULL_38_10]|uniref:Uncharacterized protein n=1 Tax=Candidatus Roizmanbacteria bacterium RIFOXYD1_FULL_38_12 TaxID=1802093 RepID=A0A1F7L100_9BACT|nr:MAG: hypothetical protein A3K47_03320 [Candidatus Roizmanbacteria bacterium RIFOXYA2_FULL_38_14]OGK63795.1 MAG: hypothetical protein A3K27_03320 [Candidatus Roizmanbacteria bacterium RIFOXYA1_FULL_37_12]OGK65641.1 MAG: hypothetical protein A3K38_03320 [Candidatus Roizmanbacteria bacterium RIFOXYB1_FULL_40_23]OGK67471.1 MAG: hypothetical protein A2334_03525 [Candidatus Roizmanbacteria bacterium RIFOXYB2_FULL_38_10]OGK70046.1 MAG: hypothetical protein A3K21_03325 [Candidatus Roizmanbacteria ba